MVNYCAAYNCKQKWKKGGPSFHKFPRDPKEVKKWVKALRWKNFIPTKYSRLCCKHFTEDSFECSAWSSKKVLKVGAIPTIFDFPEGVVFKKKPRKPPSDRSSVTFTSPATNPVNLLLRKETQVGIQQDQVKGSSRIQQDKAIIPHSLPKEYSVEKGVSVEDSIISSPDPLSREDTPSDIHQEPVTSKEDSLKCNNNESSTEEPSPVTIIVGRRKRKLCLGDYDETDLCSPTQAKKYIDTVRKVVTEKNKKIRTLRKKEQRLKKKIMNLKSLVVHLNSRNLACSNSSEAVLLFMI